MQSPYPQAAVVQTGPNNYAHAGVAAPDPIGVELDGDVRIVVVRGEHDISTAPALREQLDELRAGGGPVVVDLSEAEFIDSAVLGVLIAAYDQSAAAGIEVAFVVSPESGHTVRRIVDLLGVRSILPIADTRAGAVRAVENGGAD
jgi:anti-sigma B factor antagonist